MVVGPSQDHNIWYESLKGSIRTKSESRLSQVGKLNQHHYGFTVRVTRLITNTPL